MSNETEMPDRLWAWQQTIFPRFSSHGEGKDTTEYVRADLFYAKDKRIEELEAQYKAGYDAGYDTLLGLL